MENLLVSKELLSENTYKNISKVTNISKKNDFISFIFKDIERFSFFIDYHLDRYVLFVIDELYQEIFSLGEINSYKDSFHDAIKFNEYRIEFICPYTETISFNGDKFYFGEVDGLDNFLIVKENYGIRVFY